MAIQHGDDDINYKRSNGKGHEVVVFRLVKLPQNSEHVLSVWNLKIEVFVKEKMKYLTEHRIWRLTIK